MPRTTRLKAILIILTRSFFFLFLFRKEMIAFQIKENQQCQRKPQGNNINLWIQLDLTLTKERQTWPFQYPTIGGENVELPVWFVVSFAQMRPQVWTLHQLSSCYSNWNNCHNKGIKRTWSSKKITYFVWQVS